jgi:hypothetical protein
VHGLHGEPQPGVGEQAQPAGTQSRTAAHSEAQRVQQQELRVLVPRQRGARQGPDRLLDDPFEHSPCPVRGAGLHPLRGSAAGARTLTVPP